MTKPTEQQVKDFLHNPVFDHFLQYLMDKTVSEWEASTTKEEREEIWHIRKALTQLRPYCLRAIAVKPEKRQATDF